MFLLMFVSCHICQVSLIVIKDLRGCLCVMFLDFNVNCIITATRMMKIIRLFSSLTRAQSPGTGRLLPGYLHGGSARLGSAFIHVVLLILGIKFGSLREASALVFTTR